RESSRRQKAHGARIRGPGAQFQADARAQQDQQRPAPENWRGGTVPWPAVLRACAWHFLLEPRVGGAVPQQPAGPRQGPRHQGSRQVHSTRLCRVSPRAGSRQALHARREVCDMEPSIRRLGADPAATTRREERETMKSKILYTPPPVLLAWLAAE